MTTTGSNDAFDALVAGYYRDRPTDRRLVDTRILYQLREHAWAARQVSIGNTRDERSRPSWSQPKGNWNA